MCLPTMLLVGLLVKGKLLVVKVWVVKNFIEMFLLYWA